MKPAATTMDDTSSELANSFAGQNSVSSRALCAYRTAYAVIS